MHNGTNSNRFLKIASSETGCASALMFLRQIEITKHNNEEVSPCYSNRRSESVTILHSYQAL